MLPSGRNGHGMATVEFERACASWRPRVFRFLLRRTLDPGQADDLTQEVFVRAYGRLADLARRRDGSGLALLYTIAQRQLIDDGRRRRRERLLLAALSETQTSPTEGARSLGSVIRETLDALPATQRGVVVLHLIHGWPFAAIAEQLDTTEAACKMRYRRGIEALRVAVVDADRRVDES